MTDDCLFCRLAQTKYNVLYEDKQIYIIKDIAPKAEQHFLVIPKMHVRDLSKIASGDDIEVVAHMIETAKSFVNSMVHP